MNGKRKYSEYAQCGQGKHGASSDYHAVASHRPDSSEVRHDAGWMNVGKGCPWNPGVIVKNVQGRRNKLAHLIPKIGKVQDDGMRKENYEEKQQVEVCVCTESSALHATRRHGY